MIGRREILEAATATSLLPQVVEKDYVLGWLLAGIYNQGELADDWIFKGGTCLKKCFFETYRFSEDLDFTLRNPEHLEQDFLAASLGRVAAWVYEQAGLELPADRQEFNRYRNPRGNWSCRVKIPYRGPIAPRGKSIPNIKLDLTADERLVLEPVRLTIHHPYSDEPEGGIQVAAYAYPEAFAEKVRALGERARARDLYDVVNLYRNVEARPEPGVLLDVLSEKCRFKGIRVPVSVADLEPHRADLAGAWDSMLRHQLPALPPVQQFWDALPEFFVWLKTGVAPPIPSAYRFAAGETALRGRTFPAHLRQSTRTHLEIIRFAAANLLCVDLLYGGENRRIETYSLRQTKDGNIVLHAFDTRKQGHRSYRLDRIQHAAVTDEAFTPRYAVELNPSGPLPVRPTTTRVAALASPGSARRSRPRKSARRHAYECPLCRRRFYRDGLNAAIRPHKSKEGWPCSGRQGIYLGLH